MGTIVWLASYPKSGNTWVRAFLTNYRRRGAQPADINDLDGGPIASERRLFDNMVGVEASDLTPEEIARYRSDVYRRAALESDETIFFKVHDAFRRSPGDDPTFPADVTARAVYIVRNPLDVSVSLAHHGGVTLDRAVARLCEGRTLAESGSRLRDQLEQVLRSWSDHVRSWVDESGLDAHVVRYEDMVANPQPTFAALVAACDLPVDHEQVERAMQFSRFDVLQSQEQDKGFVERPLYATAAFFRNGRIGDWRTALTSDHVRRVLDTQGKMMRRFGYLNEAGEPVP